MRQVDEVPLQKVAKYLDEGLRIKGLHVEQVEVPDVPHGDDVPSSDGGQHGSHKVDAAQVLELFGLEVEPSSVVHPLSEQLDGRLCSIDFFLGHVQVVDEDNDFIPALFRPILTLSPPGAHLAVDQPLDLVNVGLP